MTGPVIPTKGSSIHYDLQFPFERWNRLGWGKSRGIYPTQGIRIEF
jgi:hypothetical protein